MFFFPDPRFRSSATSVLIRESLPCPILQLSLRHFLNGFSFVVNFFYFIPLSFLTNLFISFELSDTFFFLVPHFCKTPSLPHQVPFRVAPALAHGRPPVWGLHTAVTHRPVLLQLVQLYHLIILHQLLKVQQILLMIQI